MSQKLTKQQRMELRKTLDVNDPNYDDKAFALMFNEDFDLSKFTFCGETYRPTSEQLRIRDEQLSRILTQEQHDKDES